MIHDGPFGASFWELCSLCRVLVDSLIVYRIGVVLYYTISINLYYTITFFYYLYYTTKHKKTSKINDLGLLMVRLYYTIKV